MATAMLGVGQASTIDLCIVILTLHFQDKAYLIMVDDLLDMLEDSVCEYFIEYFCISIPEGNQSGILFLC